MDWTDVYSKPATQHEINEAWRLHGPFMQAVLEEGEGGSYLEVGVGSGAFLMALRQSEYAFAGILGVDNVPETVAMLQDIGQPVEQANAFALPYEDKEFAVAYSQGFMEHFSDAEIIQLVQEQLRVAKSVVFSVPSVEWAENLDSNERHLLATDWLRILYGHYKIENIFSYWDKQMICVVICA